MFFHPFFRDFISCIEPKTYPTIPPYKADTASFNAPITDRIAVVNTINITVTNLIIFPSISKAFICSSLFLKATKVPIYVITRQIVAQISSQNKLLLVNVIGSILIYKLFFIKCNIIYYLTFIYLLLLKRKYIDNLCK